MEQPKAIGFVFIDKFADWEFGFLAAAAAEWFGLRTVALTPEGGPVRSMAGFRLAGERGLTPGENDDLDAVVLIGSDGWAEAAAPDMAPLLESVAKRGGIVGGICGGTLGLARAGFFHGRRHTSNGREWIAKIVPGYAGAEGYQDVAHAVADDGVVSAPGSAPGTFAVAVIEMLLPERKDMAGEMRALFAREYQPA